MPDQSRLPAMVLVGLFLVGLLLLLLAVPFVCLVVMYTAGGLSSKIAALAFVSICSLYVLTIAYQTIATYARKVRRAMHKFDAVSPVNAPKSPVRNLLSDFEAMCAASLRSVVVTLLASFLLIASAFALAYHAIPGSLTESGLGPAFYFSLVTLATVGYGDVQAMNFGRVLAVLEILSGLALGALVVSTGAGFVTYMLLEGPLPGDPQLRARSQEPNIPGDPSWWGGKQDSSGDN